MNNKYLELLKENLFYLVEDMLDNIEDGAPISEEIDFTINCIEVLIGADFNEDQYLSMVITLTDIVKKNIGGI